MSPNDWKKTNELFHRALELPKSERAEFLRENCGDVILRKEIEELLAAQEVNEDFLQTPVFESGLEFISVPDTYAGERIGAYQIIDELGRGGMGTVYQAFRADGTFERRVAIKLLPRHNLSEMLAQKFQRERQILANLNHPFIARLFDGGEMSDGTPYFVMELVRGSSIIEFCRERNLTVDARLKLFLKVCEAVEYAHGQGIVHRDLKPSNILVTKDDTPRLLDFGIAGFLSNESIETTANFGFLTPEYASPEQLRGGKMEPASDIYSLGVLLYEMLAARKPFEFENRSPLEIAQIVCDDEPEKPSTAIYRPRQTVESGDSSALESRIYETSRLLRGDLDNIVLKAMRKEPARRYRSAAELAADIENYLKNLPVKARPNGFLYLTEKFVKRNRVATLLALLLAVFVGISVVSLLPKQAAKIYPASIIAQDEAVKITDIPVTDEYLKFSADGKNLFFVSNRQLYSVGIDGKNLTALKIDRPTLRIAESPDGKQFAFSTKDGIFTADKNFTYPKKIDDCPAGRFSWSPDSRQIAFGCSKDGKVNVFVADTDGQHKRQLTDARFCSDAAFAPDGKRIAYVCESDGKIEGNLEIYAMNTDGSNQIRLTRDAATDRLPVWAPDGKHLAFTSNRTGLDEIYVMNADDGSDLWRATFSRWSSDEPAWSADGKFLAFRSDRDGVESLYTLNVEPKILAEQHAEEIEGAFSPDGREIVCSGNRHGQFQIFRRDPDGANLRQLTWGNSGNGFPRYSPDGEKIVFSSNRDGLDELYLMNPDGTNQVRLTETEAPSLRPSWSFDGKRLVFVKIIDQNKEIFTLDLFSGQEIRLTFDPKNDDFPAWTPDGKIVFFSDRSGVNEVYQMDADGSKVVDLSNNPANDGQMAVAKDGRIVFTSNRTRVTELWLMNADGSNQIQLTDSGPDGFNSRPQFSADGRRVIYNAEENDREVLRVISIP